jgi:ABC transporter transmembrane region./ABC transporter.
MLRKFISYYKPHIWLLILDLVCALLISAADLVYPMVTRDLINNVIPQGNTRLIFIIGGALFIIYFIRMIMEYIVGYYGHLLGVKMEYDMRKELFSHIMDLSFDFFDSNRTGHIMSRVVNDLNEISEMAHHGPEDLLISTIKIIGAFILLCTINIRLTFIIFTIVPFMLYFMVTYNFKLEKTFRKMREKLADVNAGLENSISGIRVVKSFTNEDKERVKFDRGNEMFKEARGQAVKQIGIFDSGTNFLSNLTIVITIVAGGYYVSAGMINSGDLVAYLIYISQFLQPLNTFVRFTEMFQQGMAGFKRFQELMSIEPTIVDKPGAIELNDIKGDVEFDDVSFSYDGDKKVLSGINLKVRAGETVAIVGPSGAGKTTLCSLIPRFYDIDSGTIRIDGIDIRDITLNSLRKNIGIVQQDVFLFPGSIKENISYGYPEATDEDIIEAARLANAHDFIMEMPYGYDTYIGERGVRLSGGQKQRISIARMFLKNPRILILDEATSSLDTLSEAVIQESIERLAENRTTFIIAHRLATIRNARRIIVLTENGIEEEGSHAELISRKGLYYELYNSQFESLLTH